MGKDGALLCAEGKRLYQPAPDGEVIGTVGAGDSLVAGFAAGWQRYGDMEQALRLGVACGSATACSEGLADSHGVEIMLAKMPEMKEV
jgi:1-phosphofructokinase